MNEMLDKFRVGIPTLIEEVKPTRPIAVGPKETFAKDILWGAAEIVALLLFGFVLLPILGAVTLIRRVRGFK